ncbi:MAG: UDP-N-acetylglucosamine 2-epimerase [Pseudomonadota bacterium]
MDSKPTRRIAVFSSSRADYSHLYWVLQALEATPSLEPALILFGAHLAPEFGTTGDQVGADGVRVAARIESLLSSDTDVGMAKSMGVSMLGLADALAELRPDLCLVIADRYEMLAAGAAAMALRIPIVHVEGGEVSRGAVDDAVRNALTKLAHVHLAPHAEAAARIRAMGEEPWRIHDVGAPSLDHLQRSERIARATLLGQLGLPAAQPLAVVALHPVTLEADTLGECDAVFAALAAVAGSILFCFPNADAGSRALIERARRFCEDRADATLRINLPAPTYFSALAAADLMLGNSSSGIMESASFRLPTVDIGRRQEGRHAAANIIRVPADRDAIVAAVARARSKAFRSGLEGLRNPYGDGNAGERIAAILADLPGRNALLDKAPAPLS